MGQAYAYRWAQRVSAGLVLCVLCSVVSLVRASEGLAVQGGTPASTEAPWTAQLDMSGIDSESGRCTGSVLASRWILTAKHCLTDNTGKSWPAIGYTITINGRRFHLASHGIRSFAADDIALLKVSRSVKPVLTKPLPLAPTLAVADDFVDHGVTFFGFGVLAPAGSSATTVQQTPDGSYLEMRSCQGSFGSAARCFVKTHSYEQDHVAVLPGDSGGPWVVWEDGDWVEIALEHGGRSEHTPLSRGPEDGPSVAASAARSWIVSQVGEILDPPAGRILRNPDTGAAWVVAPDHFRRWIPTAGVYNCLLATGAMVESRDQFDIETIPDHTGDWADCDGTDAVVDDGACLKHSLAANDDDGPSDSPDLGSTVDYFDQSISRQWANHDDNVTFAAPLATCTPFQLTTTNPDLSLAMAASGRGV